MQLHDGDQDVTEGLDGGFGLVTARTVALSPGAQVIIAAREAAAAAAAAETETPFYKKPIFIVGTALAAIGVVGTIFIYRKRRARVATAMADLMAEANCVKKSGDECECWEFSDGQRVCLR